MLAPPLSHEAIDTAARRRRAWRRVGVVAGLAVLAIGVFVGLERASVQSFGGNSDGATVVLEGVAIGHGHLLLGGWDLSLDSFWTVDALVYAVAVSVLGLRADLLHLVPAAIALGVVVLGSVIARARSLGFAALVAVLAVVAELALPNPILAFFFLQGPWHVCTALWCLLAFCALARARFGPAWAVGVLLLAAGMLGDLQAFALGVVPSVLAGLTGSLRARDWRRGAPLAAAGPASVVVALGVRFVTVRIGTFSIAHGTTHAHAHQLPTNLGHVFTWGAALLGVGGVPIGPAPAIAPGGASGGNPVGQGFHVLAIALVLLGVGGACWSLCRGILRRSPESAPSGSMLDDQLLFGVVASAALFIALCPNGNADYARYLCAGVLFGVVLGARRLGELVSRIGRPLQRAAAISAVLLTLGAAIAFQADVRRPAAPQPAFALSRFLLAHHLTEGVGDYWSSSLVSVVSDGAVEVRPVIPTPKGRLVRYGRQSSASWYLGKHFQFLVYDTARPWRRVDSTTADESFGDPTAAYAVGTYRVLVYAGGVVVSAIGYSRS